MGKKKEEKVTGQESKTTRSEFDDALVTSNAKRSVFSLRGDVAGHAQKSTPERALSACRPLQYALQKKCAFFAPFCLLVNDQLENAIGELSFFFFSFWGRGGARREILLCSVFAYSSWYFCLF